jgi:hypothetical protein
MRIRSFTFKGSIFLIVFFMASLVLGFALWKNHGGALVTLDATAPEYSLQLQADQETYAHDHWVTLTLRPSSDEVRQLMKRSTAPVVSWVERDGTPVVTVGEMEKVKLVFEKAHGLWRARWPIPWNAPDGIYSLRLTTTSLPVGIGSVQEGNFSVASRDFDPVPAGFGVLTLEGLGSLNRFPGPNGGPPSAGVMAEWAEFIGADAVLIQGAESSGYSKKLSSSFPWQMRSTQPVASLAHACHARGLKLGVYVLSYMVGGPPAFSPDYAYGWHYQNGRPVYGMDLPVRRGISLEEDKRPGDIVKVLDRWASVEGVDFLGLDYIRPVFGGNELVDEFVQEMPGVQKPEGYNSWTKEQRMAWIARGRYIAPTAALRNDPKFKITDQWFWYRAHRTAGVVRKIVEGFGGKKPIWAFTLSWQKGWEHGQDPSMMRDAGVDMNGIMLYEADGQQYRGLLSQWNAYTRDSKFNLVVGNTFDWRLHQKTLNPSGPEEMVRRTLAAVEKFQEGKPVRGIFMHDLARALRGNLGPYPPQEWFLAAGGAMTRVREIHHRTPYRLSLTVPGKTSPYEPLSGTVTIDPSTMDHSVSVKLYSSSDMDLSTSLIELTPARSSATFVARWKPSDRSPARGDRPFIAARSFSPDKPRERCQIHMAYVQGYRKGNPGIAPPAREEGTSSHLKKRSR